MLIELAPAKVNIVLEVLGKRDDGYHEIRSLVQAIDMYDILSFEVAEEVSLECTESGLQTWDNLVIQAAKLLINATGCQRGVRIKLEKRIPWCSGLGGGSSDAATTLLALNKLWGLELTISDLLELAAELGADVSFFLYNGIALIEGKGEKVIPLLTSVTDWFVLLMSVLPKMSRKTAQMYSSLDDRHFSHGQFIDKALVALSRHKELDPSLFFNAFDSIAFDVFPGLEYYWQRFTEAGASDVHLVGAGPTLLAPVSHEAGARDLCNCLCDQGFEAYSVATISSRGIN